MSNTETVVVPSFSIHERVFVFGTDLDELAGTVISHSGRFVTVMWDNGNCFEHNRFDLVSVPV